MAKKDIDDPYGRLRPRTTPQAEENLCMSLAVDLAKKQLLEGTASSQVITHYLKLASSRERMEQELLEKKIELARANTQLIEAQARQEELYQNAIQAFKSYGGANEDI